MGGIRARLTAALARARAARPGLDHLVRMQGRMSRTRGSMLAGSVTYAGFLSIFPILLLAVSVLGFVLSGQPDLEASILKNVGQVVPGQLGSTVLDSVQSSKAATGVVGLVGTALAGLGWLSTLRTSMQIVWAQEAIGGNAILAKLQDALTLVGFGLLLVVSTGTATAVAGLAGTLAEAVVGSDAPGLKAVLYVVSLLLGVVANTGLFLFVFLRLSRINHPRRRFVQGALLAGTAFWALQNLLFFVVKNSLDSSSQVYGAAIGGVFALLLYIRYVTLIMMYAAAWMVTAPYCDDVLPSGTALLEVPDAEAARLVGESPEQVADLRQKIAETAPGGLAALPGGGSAVRPDDPEAEPRAAADQEPEQDPGENTMRPALARLARGGQS